MKKMSHAKELRSAKQHKIPALRWLEGAILVCGIAVLCYAFGVGVSKASETMATSGDPEPAVAQDKDYSKFTHTNQFHSRLPCLLCHRRDDNSPRMRFPGQSDHLPCAGCHALQFSDKNSAICTICHTNADTGAMKRFPSLKTFGFKFDHSRHRGVNCATCHKPSGRGGQSRSIPQASAAHNTCFQCHTSSSPSASCSTCHQQGRVGRTSEWSIAYRKNFSHAKHLKNMNCSVCHTVRPGAARGRQMTAPLVSMHFAPANSKSCGGCHNGSRAFGPDDFSNCKRCHNPNTFKF